MADFMKKAGIMFWINVATVVLALVGWVMYMVTNSVEGHAFANSAMGLAFGIIAVVLVAAGAFTTVKFGSQNIITFVVKTAALVLIMVAVAIVLADRAVTIVNLMTWDNENTVAWNAFYTTVVSVAFYLVAVFTIIATAFMDNKKEA